MMKQLKRETVDPQVSCIDYAKLTYNISTYSKPTWYFCITWTTM